MLDALLELQKEIFSDDAMDEQELIELIALEKEVDEGELIPYYNMFFEYREAIKQSKAENMGKRAWLQEEYKLILYYVTNSRVKKMQAFKDLAQLLKQTKRTQQAIQFIYYNKLIDKKLNDKEPKMPKVQEIKVEKVEPKSDLVVEKVEPKSDLVVKKVEEKSDLLNDLTTFIQGAQQLDQFNIEEFFRGISILTALAAHNTNNSAETDALKEQIEQKNEEILALRQEVERLTKDITGIRKAIEQFEAMDGIEKIVNMKEYSEKLRYMIDKFGNVLVK